MRPRYGGDSRAKGPKRDHVLSDTRHSGLILLFYLYCLCTVLGSESWVISHQKGASTSHPSVPAIRGGTSRCLCSRRQDTKAVDMMAVQVEVAARDRTCDSQPAHMHGTGRSMREWATLQAVTGHPAGRY